MQTRRKFLRWSALSLPFLSLSRLVAKSNPTTQAVVKPIVVSTWDSGLPVNAVAWKILRDNNGCR